MEVLLFSIESIMSIAILISLGCILAKKGYIKESDAAIIPFLVTRVALPSVVILNITNNFDRSSIVVLLHEILVPALSIFISYWIGKFAVRVLKIPKGRQTIFSSMFYISNCMFIGLPISFALFGEQSVIYVLEYYIPNTTALWLVVVYSFAKEGDTNVISITELIKKIFFSPLIGLVIAVIVIVLGLKIPVIIKDPLRYLGSMTTPLSMLFIGIVLSKSKLEDFKMSFDMFIAYCGRFILCPLTIVLLHFFIPITNDQLKVFIIQAATPAAAAIPILASTYGADVKYAAVLTSTSTIIFIFIVPIYMYLMHMFGVF